MGHTSRETNNESAVPRPIAVPTIPAEEIPLNVGNYWIARSGPSQLSFALPRPFACTLLSLSSHFGNVESSDEIGRSSNQCGRGLEARAYWSGDDRWVSPDDLQDGLMLAGASR